MEVARKFSGQQENKEEDSQTITCIIQIPRIIYEKDSLFNNTGTHQILPFKQTGVGLPGHYLKIDGPKAGPLKVSASATMNDKKSYFNIYTLASTNNNDYIQIIESVVHPQQVMAVKNDKVFVKNCSRSPMSYHKLKEVLTQDPEILWVSKPLGLSSMYSTLRLYTTGSTKYYLAFGSNGEPLTPSLVDPIRDEAFFNIR